MFVLLVEDDPLIASGIVAGLLAQGLTIEHAASAVAAESMLRAATFDVLILDLGLPDEDGLSLLQRLRRQGLAIPVLVLSARDTVSDRVAGLQAGSDDYLLKPFDLRELSARLHSLQRRAGGRCVNPVEHGPLRYDPSTREALLDGLPVELTRREHALLETLLHHEEEVLSKAFLYQQVLHRPYARHDRVLDMHVSHIRRKLKGIGYNAGRVETVWGKGYVLTRAAS